MSRTRELVTVAALAMAVLAPVASADTPLTCGTTVTTSVTLTADLSCSPGQNGLVVQGQNIVVNLNGHTIDGHTDQLISAGVLVDVGSSGVEVRGGTITRFGIGVRLDTATTNHVWGLSLVANVRGVDVANADDNLVERNRISGSGLDGIRLAGSSDRNVLAQNTLTNNVFGLDVFTGLANTVSQNTVSGTHGSGVAVLDGATDTALSRNTVSTSGSNGIEVQSTTGSGTTLTQNTVTGNGADGLNVRRAGVVVTKTQATYNVGNGIDAPDAVDGGGNKAIGNATPQCIGVVCSAP